MKFEKTDLTSLKLGYEKQINQKLFPSYDTVLKFFEEPKIVEQKVNNLAKDLEKYQLVGISYITKEKSSAIIKNKSTNKQIILKIGGTLEGAILEDIEFEEGYITFRRGDEKHIMELTKLSAITGSAPAGARRVSREVEPQFSGHLNKSTAVTKKGAWENKSPEEVIKLEKDKYTENLFYTDKASVEYIKENLYKLVGEMYIRPVFSENADKLMGIKVEQIKDSSVFKKVGLQTGDLITKINDTPLSSLEEIKKLFYGKELYESKELNVYFIREG
ncbi:MAG: PDZ domain-containing protein, partial [Planctomycetota bacterium]